MCQPGLSRTRRSAATGRPRWGVLYGVVVPQLAVLALTEIGGPPSGLRLAVRYVVALGTFVAMAVWVHSSRAAFDLQNWCECAGATMTVRVVHSRQSLPVPAVPSPRRPPLAPVPIEEYEVAGR